jgi:hypothetical protein
MMMSGSLMKRNNKKNQKIRINYKTENKNYNLII